MSAIWGTIPTIHSMKEIYHKKCILDQINERITDNQLFGCGIQYITEEAKYEKLPIYEKEQSLLFTADCILDNREELMTLLNITDKKTPDGTLMYLAYRKWGIECLNHFHGLYSLAVYDQATDTLFLATDPTASRCLYYYPHDTGCTFSTLLEPILNAHHNIKINELYIKDFLIAKGLRPSLSSTETPYEGVYKLEAGTYVKIQHGQKEVHRYWTPQKLPLKLRTASQCKEAFLSIFKKCVHNAVRTTGDVGIALSSGFDSTSVGVIAAMDLQQSSKDLHSYTYVPYYEQDKSQYASYFVLDEKEAVQKTAAMYPNIKPKFLNNNGTDCYQNLDKMLSIMEIPFKAYINLPSLQELFQTAVSDSCKVFLTGQYGNATISYGYIDPILYDMRLHKQFLSYLSTLNQYCKKAKEGRRHAYHACKRYFKHNDELLSKPRTKEILQPDNPFLAQDLVMSFPYIERYKDMTLPLEKNIALPKQIYEQFLYFPSSLTYIGEYETKFGLANGIILRDPTRDPELISFCHTMPYKYFAHKGSTRWLVRECLKEYIPQEIIGPYFRYGLQNGDWSKRIAVNWNNIFPCMKENLNAPVLAQYVDKAKLNSYFEEIKENFPEDDYDKSINLFFLDILSRFLA